MGSVSIHRATKHRIVIAVTTEIGSYTADEIVPDWERINGLLDNGGFSVDGS